MKLLMSLLLIVAVGGSAVAEVVDYGWEDGGTALGIYPDPDLPSMFATNVADWDGDPVYSGNFSLKLVDNADSGTPQAFLAFLYNLQDGDELTVGFWRYDDTPDASPSVRIWGHWNDDLPGDPYGYSGSASGSSEYGLGLGWDYTEYTWTVVDGHTGLVVEARTYSAPGDTVWLDDLHIETPDHVYIHIPGCSPVGTEASTLSNVRALFE